MKTKILFCMVLCSTLNLFAQGSFVYVNDDNSPNTVSAFKVNPDGSLTLIPGSPFATGGNGGGDSKIDPGKITIATASGTSFVYAGNSADGTISGLHIDPQTGALTLAPQSPLPVIAPNSNPTLAASPDGQFLFATDDADPLVHVLRIDAATGTVSEVPGSPFNVGADAQALKVSPSGRFLAVGLESINSVGIFAIGNGGTLREAPGSPVATSGSSTDVDINCHSNRVFVSNAESSAIDAFQMADNGSLSPVPGSPFPSGSEFVVAGLALNPGNQFLFTGNAFQDTVSSLTVHPNGALHPVSGSPFGGDDFVGKIATTRDGSRVYASLFASGSVDGWNISANGTLTPVPGHRFFTGQSQLGISSLAVFPAASCSAE